MCVYVYFGEERGRDFIWIGIEITRVTQQLLSFQILGSFGSLFLKVWSLFCLYQNHLDARKVEVCSPGPSLRSNHFLARGPRNRLCNKFPP